jgi:hypothetical protein
MHIKTKKILLFIALAIIWLLLIYLFLFNSNIEGAYYSKVFKEMSSIDEYIFFSENKVYTINTYIKNKKVKKCLGNYKKSGNGYIINLDDGGTMFLTKTFYGFKWSKKSLGDEHQNFNEGLIKVWGRYRKLEKSTRCTF